MTADSRLLELRIRLSHATEEEFVEKYGSNISHSGVFIATRSLKPEGTDLYFEFVLQDGSRALRGTGTVVKVHTEGSPRVGMEVRFVKLNAHSKALVDRAVARHTPQAPVAPAGPSAPADSPRGLTRKGTRPVISADSLRQQTSASPAPLKPSPAEPRPAPTPPPAPSQPPRAEPQRTAPPRTVTPPLTRPATRQVEAGDSLENAFIIFEDETSAGPPPDPAPAPAPKPALTPQPALATKREPEPVPAPQPAPVEARKPAPAPQPVPQEPPKPEPAPAPAPQPPAVEARKPAPAPEPAPVEAPKREPAPEPASPPPALEARKPAPAPEPAPVEAPKREPDPAPAPQPPAVEAREPAPEPEPAPVEAPKLKPAPEPEPAPEPAPTEAREPASLAPPVEEAKERLRALIANPIRSRAPASPPEVVLGIDLGTCWARVAVSREGKAQLIPFGERSGLPTLVAVDDMGQLLVGEAARARAEQSPRSATSGLRRLLGLRLLSPQLRALDGLLPFPVIAGPQGEACAELRGRPVSPVESTTLLLRELKAAASQSLGYEAHRAVLCVPAFFNARQRAAVRQAGAQAGLTVLRVLNAPSAAALAFGHGRGLARKRVLVVDVGGGSLEVSVVQLTGDDLEVITTGGDPTLGGMDFDARLAEALVSELSQLGKPRPEHLLDWGPVRAAAEAAKVALSEHEQTPFPLAATPAPEPLTRERLEALTADLVQRLTLTVRQVLESCALSPQGLDAVLLVGGQGRAPLVRRRLEESLGVPVAAGVDPLGSAALGAALLGQGLLDFESGKPGVTVAEVLSLPLGVAERTGSVRRVLERNTPLPARKTLVISLAAPGPLALAFFQGDAPAAMDNELLGTLELQVEQPGEAQVHFALSADGALALSVTLPGSRRQEVELASAYLEDSALEAMIARSPLAGEPETRPGGGLLSGLRKLFGRR